MSPKIFRQVLTTHGFPLSEHQTELISLVYGDQNYDIRYDNFLKDCNVLVFIINGPYTGAKSTYNARFTDFNCADEFAALMEKIKVNGPDAHPLYQWLCAEAPGLLGSKAIKWNFTKFLVDKNGACVGRFNSGVDPSDAKLAEAIEKALAEKP